MTTKTNPIRARKSLEERLNEKRAQLERLERLQHEQAKRDLQRLKLRLGTAAVAAGFTADWTDAQVERAMAAAVKTREGAAKTAATPAWKSEAEAPKVSTPAISSPPSGPART
jgi:hypothetical protein